MTETKTVTVKLQRETILDDVPLGIRTPLAEVELPEAAELQDVIGAVARGDAGPVPHGADTP